MSTSIQCACGGTSLPQPGPSTQFTKCPKCSREIVIPGQPRPWLRRRSRLTLGLLLAALVAAMLLGLGVYTQVQDASDRAT
jgi:hypothetical protein